MDEKPTEDYSDIGGLDKQIQELVEAVVLPVTHKERFEKLGIKPPKGVLLYGPPGTGVPFSTLTPVFDCAHCTGLRPEGASFCRSANGINTVNLLHGLTLSNVCPCSLPTLFCSAPNFVIVYTACHCSLLSRQSHLFRNCTAGKTLIARACAAQTNATFLKLAGPQLVQMFIGDGAKLVRDAFALAKEKSPCIIFIDEIDAIGTKRFDSEVSGDREVQRTMLELLNQLDGFSSAENIKIIAATNRADILDPALMRSGRLDRKIEFPHPTEDARAKILQIHARKMNVSPDVNFEELARSTDDFNAAQLKAVCVEAGMLALRRDATEVNHEDFNEGIIAVQAKKKANLNYYA